MRPTTCPSCKQETLIVEDYTWKMWELHCSDDECGYYEEIDKEQVSIVIERGSE